jgi:hypothetical protein
MPRRVNHLARLLAGFSLRARNVVCINLGRFVALRGHGQLM